MSTSASSDAGLMVTLTDANQPSPHSQRRLRVTRENPIIRLGRASKTQAKGRVAAENNALFDSPVMSRDHAELIADIEAKTLAVRDVGSTHGTFLNGSEAALSRDTCHAVKAGDKLRFGIAINRDRDAFAPITVELGIDFGHRCGPITFQVPDDSEIEDDTQAEHVDLTQEPEVADIVDLTSEADQSSEPTRPTALSEDTADRASCANSGLASLTDVLDAGLDGNCNSIALSPGEDAGSILLSDEDDSVDYDASEIVSDISDECQQSEGGSDLDSDMETSGEDDGSDLESNVEDSGSEIHDLVPWGEDSEIDGLESDDDMGGGYVPFSFSPIPAEPVAARVATEIRGLQTVMPSAVSVELVAPPQVAASQVTASQVTALPQTPAPAQVELGAISSSVTLRAPSPSDAALIFRKPLAPPAPALAHTHQEFLAARQDNKEKITNSMGDMTSRQARPSWYYPTNGLSRSHSGPPGPPIVQTTVGQLEPLPLPTHPTGPFCALLNDQGVNSAYTYEQKKQSIADERESTDLGVLSSCQGEACSNHVNSTQAEPNAKASSKRKASDISETSPEELRAIGCGESVHVEGASSALDELTLPQVPSNEPAPVTTCTQPSTSPILDGQRPIKRLRRLASNVGIAALGGITVGAVVFGSLAATCPTF